MSRRLLFFSLLAVAAAAVCVALGVWQLGRLGERRARNAVVAARLALPPVAALGALPADTAAARFRRVRLTGRYDYAHEIAIAGRTRDGSPGVNIVTPLRLADTAVAVLVNRGWVYSPNSAQVELPRWREGEGERTLEGFVNTIAARPGNPRTSAPRTVRWIDAGALAREAGYPVTPFTVILQGDAAAPGTPRADSTPARLDVPPLDEGPHLSYAVQWFSFAVIALGGLGVVLVGERGRRR
ncbi:MAG: SURF1 family protein [Gemmatimonadaceae bacterium]